MPGMDGFEFLDRYRNTPNGRETPVIVWTNKDLTEDELGRLRASAQSLVLKRDGGVASLLQELKTLLDFSATGNGTERIAHAK